MLPKDKRRKAQHISSKTNANKINSETFLRISFSPIVQDKEDFEDQNILTTHANLLA